MSLENSGSYLGSSMAVANVVVSAIGPSDIEMVMSFSSIFSRLMVVWDTLFLNREVSDVGGDMRVLILESQTFWDQPQYGVPPPALHPQIGFDSTREVLHTTPLVEASIYANCR